MSLLISILAFASPILHISERKRELNMEKEIWKDVKGYEGLYKVSNLGNILSLKSYGGKVERMMHPAGNGTGYLKVALTKNKKQKQLLVHRIVAEAFVDNKNNFDFVNHKDENKENNRADNLEWCTKPYNSLYSLNLHPDRKQKYFKNFCDNNGKLKRYEGGIPKQHDEVVVQKDVNGTAIAIYGCVNFANKITGIKSSAIISCCEGKQHTAFGYKWEYLKM